MKALSNLTLGVFIGLILSLVFGGGMLAGVLVERNNNPLAAAGSDHNLQNFLAAYRLVTSDSYYRPFNKASLVQAAINGMLASTGDAHTLYFSNSETKVANTELNGAQFAGIGAIVRPAPRGLSIFAPLPKSPALRAGLRPDDLVTAINGTSVSGYNASLAVDRVRGRAGSVVRLRIVRSGRAPFTVSVRRAVIPPVTAYGRTLSHHLGYIEILSYGQSTAAEVAAALHMLDGQHIRGLVLDLRGNPGGYVDAAQTIVSEFLSSGVVAYEQTAAHKLSPLNVLPGHQITHVPVAILIDSNTASAAEITSAALRDDAHAYLVGTRSYGKGSMQSVFTLPDGSTLRITDRLWLTPHKQSIQGVGLKPNLVVNSTPSTPSGRDPQLQAAERYLETRVH